jgi:hypothetical protein
LKTPQLWTKDAGMPLTSNGQADLAGRRRRLGASRETMAAGLGIDIDEVKAIEDGVAAEDKSSLYAASLDRVEAWPPERRAQQYKVAGVGRRFEPDDM